MRGAVDGLAAPRTDGNLWQFGYRLSVSSLELPTGVVTFLLTDIERSTVLWESAPDTMAEALARHDQLIAHYVDRGGGRLLKSQGEGDATLSVFRRASDAVATALRVHAALEGEEWAGGLDLRVRIAVHSGEAYERDGDYYGPTLNRAARVRALASGGQILVSHATAELVRDRLATGAVLTDFGQHELRGLTRDEHVFELRGESVLDELEPVAFAEVTAPPRLPLPTAMALPEGAVFIGRDIELAKLREAWLSAASGMRRAIFIAGEPGIGKTQLVGELARQLHSDGATVLYGRCDEEMLVPYQPFVEALHDYVAACPPETLRAQLQGLGGELARLVPHLAQRVADLPAPLQGEPETERYRLFEAVTVLVMSMARTQPLVLVLDDLQWADKPTLLLVRHLLRSAEEGAPLVVGIYRDDELTRVHPLAETLADLRRDQLFERVVVGGLSRDDVERLLAATTGTDVAPVLAAALFDTTEGNPFFLGEVLRHLTETGMLSPHPTNARAELSIEELGLPEGVREVVGRRLLRLTPEANHMLGLGAVVGRTFGLDVLEQIAELPEDTVLEAIEEATAARLVDEVPGRFGRYAFSHVLIRETLYRELATARRARLHRRVGEALEGLGDPTARLAELAFHFYEAAQAGDVDKAIEYCRRAGDRATEVLAYEEAAGHYEQALQAMELDPRMGDDRAGALLVALGDAWWRAGVRDRSKHAFLRAVELARSTGDGQLLGAAALGLGTGRSSQEGFDVSGTADELVIGLLEEALGLLPDEDSPLRARLLGRLAVSLYWSAPRERLVELCAEAVAMAERTGDKTALLGVLISRNYALWGPDDAPARLGAANEILHLAEALGRADRTLEARLYRIIVLLELGDVDSADSEIDAFCAGAAELRQPFYRWYAMLLPATRALLEGRFDEAERQANEALVLAEQAQDPAALPVWGGQMLFVWVERGQGAELQATFDAIRDVAGEMPAVQASSAWIALELGHLDEARATFERMATNEFADLGRNAAWMSSITLLSEVCAALDDQPRAAVLYRLLEPYTGRNVMAWATAPGGPLDYYLGLLATTMGEFEDAEARFEAALELSDAMRSPRFAAHGQYAYAIMLKRRRRPGDPARANTLLTQARAHAHALGMTALLARIDA